mmetsp:Transcript_28751/g.30912  ORF Transcript_28751/g.30912 Transcript_28751/m.30912 type:complete len:90 (+) Transcript_28751:45-314(+)
MYWPLLLPPPSSSHGEEKNRVSSLYLPPLKSREKNQVGHFEENKRIKLKAGSIASSFLLLLPLLLLASRKRIKSLSSGREKIKSGGISS